MNTIELENFTYYVLLQIMTPSAELYL